MHHIDLNASSFPNEDEHPFEDYIENMQVESMSPIISGEAQHNVHSMKLGANIMHDFDLNTSPISTNEEQSFEGCFEHNITKKPLFFTKGSLPGEVQQKAHSNNQDVMHTFDLNEVPIFNDDEHSQLDEVQKQSQFKGQGVMHYINMDASPLLRNEDQPTDSSTLVKHSSSSTQFLHKMPHELMGESMIKEDPLFFFDAPFVSSNPSVASSIASNSFLSPSPSTVGHILNCSFDALGPFHSPHASHRDSPMVEEINERMAKYNRNRVSAQRARRLRETSQQQQLRKATDAARHKVLTTHRKKINTNNLSYISPTLVPPTAKITNAHKFRNSCKNINWIKCQACTRFFPDLIISPNSCSDCRTDKPQQDLPYMFTSQNLMEPGSVPLELSCLTSLERILIARIHPVMSVYRFKGQQYKYSGNIINFPQDINAIACSLPYKVDNLTAVLVVNRIGKHGNKEFRVRRECVRQALLWLKINNIFYGDVHINEISLNELPEDGVPANLPHVQNDSQNVSSQNGDNDFHGPPEFDGEITNIDEFETSGAVTTSVQPNQLAYVLSILQNKADDETVVQMPISSNAIDEFNTPGYISMAFPALFPLGNADLRQGRPRKIRPLQYFQYLMKYHDQRFAKDPRFRYFAYNSISRWRALDIGNIYIQKNPDDGNLSIQDIREMLKSGDRQLAQRISYFAKSIRGSRSYWFARLKELTAMVKQLGAPTIFFTLSSADMQWPELYKLLDPTNELQNLNLTEQRKRRAQLLNENPLVASWFFQARVHIFLEDFLTPEFSVKDYWYRFEWQNRGSGHIHGFLWLNGAPDVSYVCENSIENATLIEYFDRLVCTTNPNMSEHSCKQEHPCARVVPPDANMDTDDDDYANMVTWVMRHSRCGSYCLRLHRTTKQMTCRFKYPFDVLSQSKIIEEPPNSKILRFLSKRNDPLVGSHNRKVLQTWRANIDWSPVLSVHAVVNYIGKYAAKSEPVSKSFTDTFRTIVEDIHRPCQTSRSAIKKLLLKSVTERDISAQEVCHLLMSYPLVRSSRTMVQLTVSEKNMLSTIIRRTHTTSDDDIVESDPNFNARYMDRPIQYENISLFDMAKKFRYYKKGWHKFRTEAIVRIIPDLNSNISQHGEKWELFCEQQVLLHHHYRHLNEAKGNFDTWSERYIDLGLTQSQTLPNAIEDEFEDDNDTNSDIEENQREEWMMAASMGPIFDPGDEIEMGLRDFDTSYNWNEALQRYPNIDIERKFIHNNLRSTMELSNETMNNCIALPLDNLSNDQRLALNMIYETLLEGRSIRMVIYGGAGTGKSTLINAIVRTVVTHFGTNKAVRIMAPTGVAAFNIGGGTIHHELSISTERKSTYKEISGEQCRRMQEDFKHTKLIIIDEYSMLGRTMIANVELRCRDIFSVSDLFGGVSVVLVGDMRQLPPVCDSSLYLKGGNLLQQHGGLAYTSFDKCVRLSYIFRQAGDEQAPLREALERLSRGTSTLVDWKLFKSRDWSILADEVKENFKNALYLFPTRLAANEYNKNRLVHLGKPIARIPSFNNCETASNASSDDAKGLEKTVYLSIGARVMLRSNLAVQHGLVNGAMGTIVDIVYSQTSTSPIDLPLAVMVNFDNYRGIRFREGTNIIPITPQTVNWKTSTGISCFRIQIPLVLCWAITIHKSQGLTLDRVIIDIGDRESLGLTFVALSRTRKLDDLAFNPMFTFERIANIGKCKGLSSRLLEEERLNAMSRE